MIVVIGAVLMSALVAGGGIVQAGGILTGLALIAFGATGMGLLLAVTVTSGGVATVEAGIEAPDGLTVRQLMTYIVFQTVDPDAKIYLGDQGLNIASGVFACLLDGQKALVIERKANS